MKHISLIAISAGAYFIICGANASHFYTNAISAHNIATFQHSIAHTAFASFDGPMARAVTHKKSNPLQESENPNKTYGHTPMYGTMSLYGEFNDNGRSGGDNFNPRQTISNAWLNWQHIGNDTKFDEIAHLNSKYNLYMGGLTSGRTKFSTGHAAWGIYTGYLDGEAINQDVNIDAQGGFFGIYNRYQNHKINISTTINSGAVNNTADTLFGIDEITNFWVGGNVNATYNITLDNTFTLQPNAQIGYTWIKSENYTSASGETVSNDAFNMIEFTPGISAIKHIGNNWFGEIGVKHIMIFDNGGDITVNNAPLAELTNHSFTEYAISLEKAVGPVALRANIGRRDGSRSGWIGGLNFKYLF
ncbi:MAG: autotransporter domain-containing protein [Alphaproteobacteria bacterium]|nr:autotransporter domain-containing protein [Alphaproteobacteria bacterium]